MPMATITAMAAMMATSVVMNGASAVGSVGSGSIGVPGEDAGLTPMWVDACEV